MPDFSSDNRMMYGIFPPLEKDPNIEFIKDIKKPKESSIEEFKEELVLNEMKNKILRLKRYNFSIFFPNAGNYIKFDDVINLFK